MKEYVLNLGCFNSDGRIQAGSVKRTSRADASHWQAKDEDHKDALSILRAPIDLRGSSLLAVSRQSVCGPCSVRSRCPACMLSLPSQSQWATSAWQSLSEAQRPTSSLTLPVWLFLETQRGLNQTFEGWGESLLWGGRKKNPLTYQDHRFPSPSPPPTPCRWAGSSRRTWERKEARGRPGGRLWPRRDRSSHSLRRSVRTGWPLPPRSPSARPKTGGQSEVKCEARCGLICCCFFLLAEFS